MTTQTKILAALLMVSIIALTTTATLGYFIYERTLSGLVMSRFEFIARELKRKVEAGLDLGLPLGELENINDLLSQEIATDNALVRLSVENARGIILFDTDAARIGSRSSSDWLDPNLVTLKNSDVIILESEIGVPLVNSFGKVVGGLLVDYSKDYYDSKRARTVRNVAAATLIVLLLSSFIGSCGVLAISRRLDYAVMRLEAGLRAILARLDLLPAVETTAPDTDLEAEIATFERKVLDVVTALERAEAAARLEPAGGGDCR